METDAEAGVQAEVQSDRPRLRKRLPQRAFVALLLGIFLVPTVAASSFTANGSGWFKPGDCTWWPRDDPDGERAVRCDSAHYIEYVAFVRVNGLTDYPADEDWDGLIDAYCQAPMERALGRKVGPDDRYMSSAALPSEEEWAGGDHRILCGVSRNQADGSWAPMRGRVVHGR